MVSFTETENSFQGHEGRGRHLVQFYRNGEYPYVSVASFLGHGLLKKQGVIFIGTPEHLAGVEEELYALGFSVLELKVRGQFLSLDAESTLNQFFVRGTANEGIFHATVGRLVKELVSRFGSIRAYGEMVDLLWMQGFRDSALELESLWNDLISLAPVSLLCSYLQKDLSDDEGVVKICRAHSHHVLEKKCLCPDATLPSRRFEVVLRTENDAVALQGTGFLNLLPSGVYICDKDGRILFYNEMASRLWGRSPLLGDARERFCGSFRIALGDGTYLTPDQTPMAICLREGKEQKSLEAYVERPDGTMLVVELAITPLRDEKGKLWGAMTIFDDVSYRKHNQPA